jgi:hypothetical protein
MRTGTFSDPKVIEMMSRRFACAWKNIRPKERFEDGLYSPRETAGLQKLPRGAGSDNVCLHVATPDGAILHSVPGFVSSDELVEELEFALRVREAGASGAVELRRERAGVMMSRSRQTARRGSGDRVQAQFLGRLAKSAFTIGQLAGRTEAGLPPAEAKRDE